MNALILVAAAVLAADSDDFKVTQGFTVSAAPAPPVKAPTVTDSDDPKEKAKEKVEKDPFAPGNKEDKPEKAAGKKWVNLPVAQALAKAKEAGKPLVVFYSQDRRAVSRCLTAQAEDDFPHVRVFDQNAKMKAMLMGTPTIEAIQERADQLIDEPKKPAATKLRRRPRSESEASRPRPMVTFRSGSSMGPMMGGRMMGGPMMGGGSCGAGG